EGSPSGGRAVWRRRNLQKARPKAPEHFSSRGFPAEDSVGLERGRGPPNVDSFYNSGGVEMRLPTIASSLAVVLVASIVVAPALAAPGRSQSRSPHLKDAVDLGRAPATERHRVVVSLDVRDRDGLEAFFVDVQDPASPHYRQFLSQAEFDALYAPTETQEQAVVDHLRGAGLRVTERSPNRLLVGAMGSVAALERAFGVAIHSVERGGKRHYAALDEPAFPDQMASYVVGVIGLDDLSERHPHVRSVQPAAAPRAALGPGCCHLSPNDVFAFYDNTAAGPRAGP